MSGCKMPNYRIEHFLGDHQPMHQQKRRSRSVLKEVELFRGHYGRVHSSFRSLKNGPVINSLIELVRPVERQEHSHAGAWGEREFSGRQASRLEIEEVISPPP